MSLRPAVDPQVAAATRATYAAFILSGLAFATWASRIPQVRSGLGLSESELGLLLLAIAVGSVLALPVAGPVIIARLGSRATVSAMAVGLCAAMVVVAAGYLVGVLPVVVGLFVFGFANGAWDVAMNVQAAAIEQRLGRAIMSRFHAGWSIGTVAGAVMGAVMVALGVPVATHLVVVAVVVGAVVVVEVRHFLPDRPRDEGPSRPSLLDAWTERRTVLVGVFVLAFAFAEGAANDWVAIAVIDGYGASETVGTLAFAAFLAAMFTGRWVGPVLLDRHGRVAVLRTVTAVALVGLLLFVAQVSLLLAFAGVLLWGLGTALGFPVGMSAGGDDPSRAAGRVSVIASIGYCAFLGGPPLIGFVGEGSGVLRALVVVAVLLGLAALLAGNLQPEEGNGDPLRLGSSA